MLCSIEKGPKMPSNIICPVCSKPGLVNGKCLLCKYDTSLNYTEYLLLGEPAQNTPSVSSLRREQEKEEQLTRERIAMIDPLAKRVKEMEAQLLELAPQLSRIDKLEAANHALSTSVNLISSATTATLAKQQEAYQELAESHKQLTAEVSNLREELAAYSALADRITALEEARSVYPFAPMLDHPEEELNWIPPVKTDLPLIPMLQFHWDEFVWGQRNIRRQDIYSVAFLSRIPEIYNNVNVWDLSEAGDASIIAWVENGRDLKVAANGAIALPENCEGLFSYFSNVESIDMGIADTSRVTNMTYMFLDCNNLSTLQLSGAGWNTSNVTSFRGMFRGCHKLRTLDTSGWKTGNVTTMAYMFRDCSGLESLDLSKWDITCLENTDYMFHGCSSLKELDISTWSVSPVMSASSMFSGCRQLRGETRYKWENMDTDASIKWW